MPEGMSQSHRVDASTMEALGDVASAAGEFKRLADQIRKDAKRTGNILSTDKAKQLEYYQANYERLTRKIAADEAKKYADAEAKKIQGVMQRDREQRLRDVQTKVRQDRQDRRAEAQEERHYFKHSNAFQRIRDFTGHATQRGYIDYARSLVAGNVGAMDFERLGGSLQGARRLAIRFGGRAFARTVTDAGRAIGGAAMRAAGPAALIGATAYKISEVLQENENSGIEAAEAKSRMSEAFFRESREATTSASKLMSMQAAMRSRGANAISMAIGASLSQRALYNLGISPNEAIKRGAEVANFEQKVETFAGQHGIKIDMAAMRRQVYNKTALRVGAAGINGFISPERKLAFQWHQMTSGGKYLTEEVEKDAEKMAENVMETTEILHKSKFEQLSKEPERKIEIAQGRLYNAAVADMQVQAWCQWNPY